MSRSRLSRLLPIAILIPLLAGARRPNWSCSSKGRWVVMHRGTGQADFAPDPSLTQDYQFPSTIAPADRFEYYGDNSSMLYVWGPADIAANPSLVGIPYVGIAHPNGEVDLNSHVDVTAATAG